MSIVEVVGVRSAWWAEDTGMPVESVIRTAETLASSGEDPYELARYLSTGNDPGASAFSRDTGGSMVVRVASSGKVLARYAGGTRQR